MAGALVHFEIPARDIGRAKSFWGDLFGWQLNDAGMEGMEYWMTRTGDEQGGAILSADGQSGLTVYFDTDDINASVARARELGGTAEDSTPIPGIGWFARCTDTEGNDFSLFQADDSAGG
jgi:predicted enzyme related to lactoylglutathione lyase